MQKSGLSQHHSRGQLDRTFTHYNHSACRFNPEEVIGLAAVHDKIVAVGRGMGRVSRRAGISPPQQRTVEGGQGGLLAHRDSVSLKVGGRFTT